MSDTVWKDLVPVAGAYIHCRRSSRLVQKSGKKIRLVGAAGMIRLSGTWSGRWCAIESSMVRRSMV